VIEIGKADFASARRALAAVAEVRSIAQLGNRLRVLMPRTAVEPERRLREALAPDNAGASVERVSASLEDVFVAATRLRNGADDAPERAA
jgi:ABC-2 type transport system ATP-binding protein